MKRFTLNNKNYLAVDVPEGATKWFFTPIQDYALLFYGEKSDYLLKIVDMDKYVKTGIEGGKRYYYEPQILGIAEKLTEKQCKEILRGCKTIYDYPVCSTAKGSFIAYLMQENINLDNLILQIK